MRNDRETQGKNRRDGGRSDDLVAWANWFLALIVVGVIGVYVYQFVAPSGAAALVGKEAPGFEQESVEAGTEIQLADYRGRVVVMDFWATWCPPCHDQMKFLQEFAGTEAGKEGPVVVLVNADKPGPNRRAKVEQYLQTRGLRHPTILDNGAVQASYRVSAFPTLVVVGPKGKVAFAEAGVHGPEELRRIVDEAAK